MDYSVCVCVCDVIETESQARRKLVFEPRPQPCANLRVVRGVVQYYRR